MAVNSSRIIANLPLAAIGDICQITLDCETYLLAQVIAFDSNGVTLAPLGDTRRLSPGLQIENLRRSLHIDASSDLLGHVVDAFGRSSDVKSTDARVSKYPVYGEAPSPSQRTGLSQIYSTGLSAIDLFCPLAQGQRIGLFAPPGVGKTTCIKQLLTNTQADVVILALVGERGREVEEFLRFLKNSSLCQRTVTVAATSNASPMERQIAPYTATALAEYFRDQGANVLLLVDSLTRAIRAMREIGLACGELPVQDGLTPSIYAEVPKLLERAGRTRDGSITAVYSVLTGQHGIPDALSEELMSLLDGHIVLSREIMLREILPAIDVIRSLSRLAEAVSSQQQTQDRRLLLKLMKRLEADKDLVLLGGVPDHELAVALELEDQLWSLLTIQPHEFDVRSDKHQKLGILAEQARKRLYAMKAGRTTNNFIQ
jgi:ATP synthase in type III secretion protein N